MTAQATTLAFASAPNEARLNLWGRFDAERVVALRPALEALAATPARRVVLDISAVAMIDGSGLGAIAFLFKRLVASGRKLVLTGASGQPLTLLTELGLGDLLGLTAAPAMCRPAPRRWFGGLVPARSV